MLEWLENNLALLSGVVVPLLLGVVKPLMERQAGGSEFRRIRQHVHLRVELPDGSEAAKKLDRLILQEIEFYVERISPQVGRKLDKANLAAIAVVSLMGGGVSYGLVTWAQAASGVWAWILWIAFFCWGIVVLLVLVGGLSSLYKSGADKPKGKGKVGNSKDKNEIGSSEDKSRADNSKGSEV